MADEQSKKRLGRGLAALIGEMDKPVDVPPATAQDAGPAPVPSDRVVPIETVRANPNNPRRVFADADLDRKSVV